jgi:23S rRNA (guanosine2251-2'-O)-methyltransferase
LLVGAQESRSLGAAIETHLATRGGGPRPEVVERRNLADLLGKEALHQGLALQVDPLPTLPIEALLEQPDGANAAGANTPRAGASIVALDQVTDPRNVGAIFRSAAAFGARGVLLSSRHAPPETGVLARAASGGLELVPRIEVTNLARALDRLKSAGWWTLGLAQEASRDLTGSMTGERIVLVLGAEGKGLRRLTRETCDVLARLPTDPEMPSLNVSNAAAVALFALAAQRPDRT